MFSFTNIAKPLRASSFIRVTGASLSRKVLFSARGFIFHRGFRLSSGVSSFTGGFRPSSFPGLGFAFRHLHKTNSPNNYSPLHKRLQKYFYSFKKHGSEDLMIHYIITSNILVFLAWKLAEMNAVEYKKPTYLNFLSRNFVVSLENVKDGRWWSVVTCAFSHKDLDHLIVNMFVLWGFGKQVLQMLGRRQFLFIYFGSALSASLSYLLHTDYTRKRKSRNVDTRENVYRKHYIGSMGASGSLMALSTIFACTFPNATFLVFFVIPAPAIVVVGLYAFYDIYRAWNVSYGRIDSAGHLGGVAFGLLYYFTKIKPRAGRYTKLWRVRI